ncbi:MAG: prepilin-type N-terminal cleavage/methylation domain-containing protein, partial [Candidatus Colwellbacteria bacterium]|nr:prepilin-type N-terminal cleavage/methylation domain-containing protein [Candidatus Colwellbacteria bacterium]
MRRNGFTLIELMVAMGLFATVLTFIVSLFLQSARAERVVAKRAAAIDNVSLAVEQMAREIRTGSNFPSVPANGEQKRATLGFTNHRGERVIYRLENGAIGKSTDNGTNFLTLSSGNVKIKKLDFWMMDRSPDG